MMPKDSWFQMTFVYGERAAEAVRLFELPEKALNDLKEAAVYVEGRSVVIEITSDKDIDIAARE